MRNLVGSLFCIAVLSLPVRAAGQSPAHPSAERADLAALLVTWEAAERGHRARLATHPASIAGEEGYALVSATVFLPEGDTVATRGLIAFVLPNHRQAAATDTLRFRWSLSGVETVVAFPARKLGKGSGAAYAAEVTSRDLRFLATARSLEVRLPAGTVVSLDGDLLRRLGLLAGLEKLPQSTREELAAFTTALDRSLRDRAGY